jgi:hypothetical protein
MRRKKKKLTPEEQAEFVARVRREKAQRQTTYREQALQLFPHVCARCGREFAGSQLRDLTVHHKDNDHMNNPPDGSNWELLCVYCHDAEHQEGAVGAYNEGYAGSDDAGPSLDYQPFEGLADLLKPEDGEPDSD